MSIQSNVNQILSLASFLTSQSPMLRSRMETKQIGKDIQGKQQQAIRGLKDIEGNMEKVQAGEKRYNEEELTNIEDRTLQYQKDIYDAKSAALNPRFKKYIKTGDEAYAAGTGIQQKVLSSQLSKIREMTARAREGLAAKNIEHGPSKDFAKQITEGVIPQYGRREVF